LASFNGFHNSVVTYSLFLEGVAPSIRKRPEIALVHQLHILTPFGSRHVCACLRYWRYAFAAIVSHSTASQPVVDLGNHAVTVKRGVAGVTFANSFSLRISGVGRDYSKW